MRTGFSDKILIGPLGALLGLFIFPLMVNAQDCGAPDAPCAVKDGVYYAALPEDGEIRGMVIWLHGAGGSGAKAVANKGFAGRFTERGYALIAAHGAVSMLTTRDWSVNDGVNWPRDDAVYLSRVRDDAVARFGLDPEHVLLAGFSRGGSMVWDAACRVPDIARGFAAVAGSFWEPMVNDCAAPVHLNHTHGFADGLVPFEGRRGTYQGYEFEQGSVMKGVNVWRRINACTTSAKNDTKEGPPWVKRWLECDAGSITLTLTSRGHGIPKGWTGRVLDWFEQLP